MAVLYIIAGITAFFAALFSFNLSLRVIFSSSEKEEMNVFAKIGFYKIYIMPKKQKKRQKAEEKRQKQAKPAEDKDEEAPPEEKNKYTVPEIFGFVKDIGSLLLKRFKKHFKAKIYKINVIVASDEAEKTALMYGAAIQSAYYLFEFLNHNFKVKKKPGSIKIITDFSNIKTVFEIDIKFHMRISHILSLLIASAIKFLIFRNKTKNLNT